MSEPPGPAGSSGPPPPDEQFTVPVPHVPRGPAPTQAIPVFEPTRELPVAAPAAPPAAPAPAASARPGVSSMATAPPVPPNPYAAQPVWPTTAPSTAADETVDPLLGQIGTALFWVVVGWWLFFVIRLLGYLVRVGATDTMVIRTIDIGAEQTVTAAVLSLLAALLLLLGRGRGGRSPLGWASLVLAVATVGIAVWRVLP